MFKYLLLFALSSHAIWAKPVQPDIASHIVIVTPQAQVHLEPGLKYEAPTTFIHHLSPLARIGAHEETIVYVPASAAAAPLVPVSVGRSSSDKKIGTKQSSEISQQIEQIQSAIQSGSSMFGPQLSEAAAAAAAAASSAGAGFFPALFPPPATSASKDEKLKTETVIYETPANTEALVPTNARFFALAPAVSHIVDFGHAPLFVGPLSAIRTRSIQEAQEAPLVATAIPEALPLKTTLKEEAKEPAATEYEKKADHGRFLEANTLKEEEKKEEKIEEALKKDTLLLDQEAAGSNKISAALPQLKQAIAKQDVAAIVAPNVVAPAAIVADVEPQSKVA